MSDGFGPERPSSADTVWGWENHADEAVAARAATDPGTGDADGYEAGRTGRGDYQGRPTGRGTVDAERTGRSRSQLRRDQATEPASQSLRERVRAASTSPGDETVLAEPTASDLEPNTGRRALAEQVRRDHVDVDAHTRGLN